jgi:hypothetical protein
MVRQEFMPPADAEPLAAADLKAITQWGGRATHGGA